MEEAVMDFSEDNDVRNEGTGKRKKGTHLECWEGRKNYKPVSRVDYGCV